MTIDPIAKATLVAKSERMLRDVKKHISPEIDTELNPGGDMLVSEKIVFFRRTPPQARLITSICDCSRQEFDVSFDMNDLCHPYAWHRPI